MKTLALLSIIMLNFNNALCQQAIIGVFDSLQIEETKDFISKTNNSNRSISQYTVFVIKEIEQDTAAHKFCFVMSYILNSYQLKYIYPPTHFFKYANNLVIISAKNISFIKRFESFNPMVYDAECKTLTLKRLFPEDEGGITGNAESIEFCDDSSTVIVKYNKFGYISDNKNTIWDYSPNGRTQWIK